MEKGTFCILDKKTVKKEKQIVYNETGGTRWAMVPKGMQDRQALTDEAIVRLAQYGVQIENHYGVAQDIEWAIDRAGRIFILQARPETVHMVGIKRGRREGLWNRKSLFEVWVLAQGRGVER